jgi:hypothetical protein
MPVWLASGRVYRLSKDAVVLLFYARNTHHRPTHNQLWRDFMPYKRVNPKNTLTHLLVSTSLLIWND